ncbi:MAG TPA: CHASE2 domain-containing protein [Candidatus Dormibacteraeota bacterium]|nr:CHASE2 domain-containing protein [Candidatus Dormibacteraeota bacterium]
MPNHTTNPGIDKAHNGTPRIWGARLGLSFLLLAMVSAFSLIPVVRDSELRVTDTFFRLAPPPAQRSPVVLVLIDDESLRQYGRWPWSRELLGRLVGNLADSGAATIGLDVLLSEPQSAHADAALQSALRASGRAVIVGKIGAFPDGPHWVEPLPAFAQAAAAVGHAHAVLDADSICRRFPPLELTIDGPRWAFAVEVARRTDARRAAAFLDQYNIPRADDPARVTSAKPILARIPFRPDPFDTISAATVLQGAGLRARLTGRPVLVGFGGTEISDRLNTPLATELPAPGVEVHAQILDGILAGRLLHELPSGLGALLLALTCVVVVVVFRRWRGWMSVALLVVLAMAVYGIAFLTFLAASRIVPAGAMLFAVMAGPLLVYAADLALVERSVTRQLMGLRSWLAVQRKAPATREGDELSWKLDLLHQLETELGSLYELHRTLLESTQDLVAIFDEKGNLLLNNQAFASALAPSSSLSLEQLRARWVPEDAAPLVSAGDGQEGEVHLSGKLYAVRTVSLPPTRLSPGGGTILTFSSLQTRVERDRARTEALAFITHELRTPLASIQGFADMMIRSPGSPDCEGAPETILWESKRLLALINSYLDVLRLDAGAKPAKSDVLELHDVARQVFDILRPLATGANMRLVLDAGAAVVMEGDATLISGAILNLVSNAIKYGKSGTDIEVRCYSSPEQVVIAVRNQGKPITSGDIPHVFDPYYRAQDVQTAKPGWGLGLAFVKRIAEKHGGSVQVMSDASGTVFEIHLPAKTGVDAPSEVMK